MAKHKKPSRPSNPLVSGILSYIETNENNPLVHHSTTQNVECRRTALDREQDIPKRYTIYTPMLLLGPTFESHTPAWREFWSALTGDSRTDMLATVVEQFRKTGQAITHVAVNAPIAPTNADEGENVMRSPLNLRPLHGDFGPDRLLGDTAEEPSQRDFQSAFWVQAAQVSGINQVWAPRWTMFSRGNVREKARILGQRGVSAAPFPGLEAAELGEDLSGVDVVDFYVGIGYFAFPYLKRGVRRVFGWEINGWSVEGLRRGCEVNGWKCLVIRIGNAKSSREEAVVEVMEALQETPDLRCIVLWADNVYAQETMARLNNAMGDSGGLNVRHCNLGLLPSSESVWLQSVRMLNFDTGGWVHVHENAEISRVAERESEVVQRIQAYVAVRAPPPWMVQCDHTEMVKTYAPGVGHFVFDIHVWPAIG